MRARPACRWGLMIVCAATAAAPAQAAPPNPVYTNKARFAIPFRSAPAEVQRLGAREVRLFVTVDRGDNWHHVQTAELSANRFLVRAPRDGAYWFAVRTIDREGRRHPDTELAAELPVIVDTKSPTLTISLSQPQPGSVQLSWEAKDEHLDVLTLLLESRQSGEKNWKRVYVAQKATGKTLWNVAGGGMVEVRARISDRAANVTVAQDSVRVAASKTSVPEQIAPEFEDPLALSNDKMPTEFPAPKTSRTTNDDLRNAARRPQFPLLDDKEPNDGGLRILPNDSQREDPRRNDSRPPAGKDPSLEFPEFPPAVQKTSRPQPEATRVPVRMVNSRQIRLNYSLEKIGSSGVQSVELFITTNNGHKWYRYGTDADQKSPFNVTVPEDGTYGFTIRVRSGVGIGDPPPKHGEKPSINIVVDQTAPKLELLPILQGRGTDNDKFLVRWKMAEQHPADLPISLSYSESPKGPWTSMTGWTAHTGQHLWVTPANVPPRVYVRITARDRGGNVAHTQTPRPIIVDFVKPSARITTVDPDSNRP